MSKKFKVTSEGVWGINYIETNYTKIPKPRSDGAIGYRDPSGNTYYLEGNHWDVTYFGA